MEGIKLGLCLGAGIIVGALGMAVYDGFGERALKRKHEAQLVAIVDSYEAQKKLNEEITNGLQLKINDLNDSVAAAKRLYGNKCLNVTHATSRVDGAAKNDQLLRPDGSVVQVSTDDLMEYAKDVQYDIERFMALQKWAKGTEILFNKMKASCNANAV